MLSLSNSLIHTILKCLCLCLGLTLGVPSSTVKLERYLSIDWCVIDFILKWVRRSLLTTFLLHFQVDQQRHIEREQRVEQQQQLAERGHWRGQQRQRTRWRLKTQRNKITPKLLKVSHLQNVTECHIINENISRM